MSDPLGRYLNDHRAGAAMAIELLEAMSERHRDSDLGTFASDMLARVREDRDVLEALVERVGTPNVLKEAAAWLGEKVTRLKLRGQDDDLGTFEALETLALGIAGKRALWDALDTIAPRDRRLHGVDFPRLASDAQRQMDLVNARRLAMAPTALAAS
jgi:hypothetical protein